MNPEAFTNTYETGVSPMEAIPERLARETDDFVVMYGVRTDDNAIVFHFFPPGGPETSPETYPKNITARLEQAIEKNFDLQKVRATYTEELGSFCIIVADLGAGADPWPLVNRFLDQI